MNFGTLLLGLLVTAIAYMAVPMIMLYRNNGGFDKKKAKKIALWNSIILGVIFFSITISMGGGAWSAGPAVLYYGINSAILTSKKATPNNWKINIIAINSNQNDRVTNLSAINKYDPVYFHLTMSGNSTSTKTRIYVHYTLPNGEKHILTSNREVGSGDQFSFGWDHGIYDDEAEAESGVFQCEFYEKDGYLLGMATIEIID